MTTPDDRPTPNRAVDVAIIGAGIGGVAAAVALHRAGFDVNLYDQAPAFTEVGGTITIDTDTTAVLGDWGLVDEVLEQVAPCNGLELRRMDGEFLNYVKLPGLTDMGVEVPDRTGPRDLFGIQRSDLHSTLLRHLPSERTYPGMRLRSVFDRGTHAEAEFDDGTVITPQVLIGADGIRSTVRKLFTDVEAQPAGVVICRSLARAELLRDDWPNDRMRRWEHSNPDGGSTNALFVPTRRGTQVGIDTSLYGGDQLLDLADDVVPIGRLLSCFPPGADPIVTSALRAGLLETRAYRLFDLPEIETWTSECVALLGDAAHAMRPLLGQGANQAIQDADELARCLVRESEVGEALASYEQVRRPFVSAIQRAAREFRPKYAELLRDAERQPSR